MENEKQLLQKQAEPLFLAEAKEEGFVQFIKTISKTFLAIPVGWLVLYVLIHKQVPQPHFIIWVSIFFAYWLYAVYMFNKIHKEGAATSRHLLHVNIILILEGVLWGTVFLAFMGYSLKTDTWVAIFFAGIISVILPTYITYPKSFHVVILSAIISAIASFILIQDRIENVTEAAFTVTMYLTALGFLIKPISIRVIEGIRLELENKSLTRQLRESLAKMSHQANTDALTGHLNRHALSKALGDLVVKGERRRTPFSLLMMDIDFFKAINDTYGHDVGDKALQHVAQCISGQLRSFDLCARFGGEEFIVLLPSTNASEAMDVAERIRKAVESSPLADPHHPLTISIGVATYKSGMSTEALLKTADNAVYEAKENGRNQVRQFQMAVP
ncbi:GGDEF domain-containing protein [Alkalimonas sp.]|uniref:GGDEF domain-containing protein n=1 Tax=Alkalimonas sp. TaxID=1872453 RepID=UPI00263B7188|nr:GGDEF domain-containing protein [Alkalimonas sp.]MCC5825108.1 GGDEF domain-containing protein [Alkalimonas sp.]